MTTFPSNFTWGVAAAAYQIEGAHDADGRGPSVWDAFCQQPGKIREGHSGAVACDHYHRWAEDVALMRELGVKAYRLSIGWPRVLPQGVGAINQPGLDFYDRLIDALLEAGITPWVTLFHWDYPLALYNQGGWLNPASPHWFAEYATTIAKRLGDRVRHWFTHNEPQCFIGLGHATGLHAPGLKLGLGDLIPAGHHMLLAHGLAVQAIRAHCPKALVGMAPVGRVKFPATDAPADLELARRSMFNGTKHWHNSWYSDPAYLGHYPADGLAVYEPLLPRGWERDLATIAQPLDFYGANIYGATPVQAGPKGEELRPGHAFGGRRTAFDWIVTPESLYWGPRFFYERYQKPIVITENGMASSDWPALDGKVYDPQRIDFTARHLLALRQAIADGTNVSGYFHWSILDNFEWQEGYTKRFGLIYVDYATQRRIIKQSAYWYADLIASNGALLDQR
ncbi:MAG: GH1 family beta-glucosidase [Oscillochloridaceae bacterium umkhey_bin13]